MRRILGAVLINALVGTGCMDRTIHSGAGSQVSANSLARHSYGIVALASPAWTTRGRGRVVRAWHRVPVR